jgi:pentatricopeptide repeat protein
MLDGATSFSPSAVSYRHLTKGLAAAGRIQDALDLVRDMLSRGQGADSLVYKNLIDGYIRLDDWDRAFELFAELREKTTVYDGVVHTGIMEGYWSKGMDKEAMDSYRSLLDMNFKMTPATCNVLLQTLFKHDKHKEGDELWETMIDNHNPPSFIGVNSESYTVMVNRCFNEGRFHDAIEVFHRLPRKNVQFDVACYNNIIGKLCENGMLQEAEKLFEEMESKSVLPDVYTYTYIVDSCFKAGRVEDTMQYFHKMADGREHGPKFNIAFFNRMFEGLTEGGRIEDALKVYGRMSDKEIKPSATTFEILVKAACKEGELDKARDLVRDMARGGVVAPDEFREYTVEVFKNADRQEEIEQAFEEKPVPVQPQPRPEFRPRSSPQGLPGFAASNQTRGSYTPQQGQSGYGSPQPFHHGDGVPKMLQLKGISSEPEQLGYGTPRPQPSADVAHQTQHPGYGTSRQWQTGYGSHQAQQPAYGSQQVQQPGYVSHQSQQPGYVSREAQQPGYGSHHAGQPGYGAHQAQQPGYGAHQAQQPGYGAHQAQQPGYGAHQAQQPGYGAHQAQQPGYNVHQVQHTHQAQQHGYDTHQAQRPGYGAPQPSQPPFAPESPQHGVGTARSLPRHGQIGNQHDQFGPSPQGGPKFDTQPPWNSGAHEAPQSSLCTAQGLPHYGHRGNQQDQFRSPQGGQKLDTPQPQDSGSPEAPQSSLDTAQSRPHYGHIGNQHGQFGSPTQGGMKSGSQSQHEDFGAHASDEIVVKYAERY